VGGLLALVTRLGLVVLRVVLVAEDGVGVEGDLGIEHMHPALRREDQRVDLDEVGVAFGVGHIQLAQDLDGLVGGGRVEVGALHPGPGGLFGESLGGIDEHLADGVGVLGRHCLDLDAALGRQHSEMLLGRAVQREAGVVLLGDVRGLLDPEPMHDMAVDVEPQDVAGVGPHIVDGGGELHASRLAAPAGMHLRLDHHRRAQALRGCHRFVDAEGDFAVGYRHAVAAEELLALILEEIHGGEHRRGRRLPAAEAAGPPGR